MKKLKKGFTLVELVIVIAVIAVLAAVLIPTFSGIIQRSKISADTQLATQLNTMAQDADTLEEFVDAVEADDKLSVNSLVPQVGGHKFLWVEKAASHSIIYVDGALNPIGDNIAEDALEDAELWTVVTAANQIITNPKLRVNYFLGVDSNQNFVITNLASFDTGDNTLKGNLSISDAESNKTANVDGNFAGTVTINAPSATINQNGSVSTLDVTAVASNSLHVNGFVKNLNLTKGKVELANTAYVSTLKLQATTAKVVNGGVIATLDKATEVTLSNDNFVKSTGTVLAAAENSGINAADYKNTNFAISINDLAGLENFRDAVNGGATYDDVAVELTADIRLNDGWTPIGNFARKAEGVTGFQGTFDGNGHTISNLNNIGYNPQESVLFENNSTITGKKEYSYGLFGRIDGATIQNLSLTNVNIDIPSNTSVYGDSVAALVGFAAGATISDITVGAAVNDSSKVSAYDGVGAILGRNATGALILVDCTNYASIIADEKAGGIVGIVYSGSYDATLTDCNNYGTVTVDAKGMARAEAYVGGIVGYTTGAVKLTLNSCVSNGNVTLSKIEGLTIPDAKYIADKFVAYESTKTPVPTTPDSTGSAEVTKN